MRETKYSTENTVIVTGAAGALGREVVLKLNARNERLVLVDRLLQAAGRIALGRSPGARHLCQQCRAQHHRHQFRFELLGVGAVTASGGK